MSQLEIVSLNFNQPDERIRSAAELLVSSLMYVDKPGTEDEIRTCIEYHQRRVGEEHYALIDAESGLVAAASARHGLRENPASNETYTYVGQIAVAVVERHKGRGGQLMHHIMVRARSLGDSYVTLTPLEPAFFSKLGFSESDHYMRASLLEAA